MLADAIQVWVSSTFRGQPYRRNQPRKDNHVELNDRDGEVQELGSFGIGGLLADLGTHAPFLAAAILADATGLPGAPFLLSASLMMVCLIVFLFAKVESSD